MKIVMASFQNTFNSNTVYRHVRLVVDEICFPYISETIGLFDIFSLPTVKTIYGVFPIEGYL